MEQFSSDISRMQTRQPSVKKALLVLGLGLSAALILFHGTGTGLMYWIAYNYPNLLQSDFLLLGLSTLPLTLIVLPAFWLIMRIIPKTVPGNPTKLSLGNLSKIFVISYVIVAAVNVISMLLNAAISELIRKNVENPLNEVVTYDLWVVILFTVIVSPIVEEILFRHIIISRLAPYGGGLAVFASAFAFGLFHGNLFQMFYAFALGLIFGAVTYRTGRIRYAIILHIAINFVGGVLAPMVQSGDVRLTLFIGLFVFAILITGIVLGILQLTKVNLKKMKAEWMPKGFLRPFMTNPGILVYTILILVYIGWTFSQSQAL